jgi:DNA-directed RNA polymerase subunit RPC12/RpoP
MYEGHEDCVEVVDIIPSTNIVRRPEFIYCSKCYQPFAASAPWRLALHEDQCSSMGETCDYCSSRLPTKSAKTIHTQKHHSIEWDKEKNDREKNADKR